MMSISCKMRAMQFKCRLLERSVLLSFFNNLMIDSNICHEKPMKIKWFFLTLIEILQALRTIDTILWFIFTKLLGLLHIHIVYSTSTAIKSNLISYFFEMAHKNLI